MRSTCCEEAVEESLLEAERRLQVACPYRQLPEAIPEDAAFELQEMIVRPPKYHAKYLLQEWSILGKLFGLAEKGRDLCVVDIGAGNGSLALLAALLLDSHALLIDHTLPPEPMRVENRLPLELKQRLLRLTGDVGLLKQEEMDSLLEAHGIKRVLVIAKHLCGVATDLALELLKGWCGSKLQVQGTVMATCCMHKIAKKDMESYADLHLQDPYLQQLTGGERPRLLEFLRVCTRCVAWRTTAEAHQSRISEKQVRLAELFEDALQQPRGLAYTQSHKTQKYYRTTIHLQKI